MIIRDVRTIQARERAPIIDEAAALLRAGELVVIPTETVYGIAASAASAVAVERLRKLVPAPAQAGDWPVDTWHAADREDVIEALGMKSPVHRRVFERLTPGPIRVLAEVGEARSREIVGKLGAVPGAFDSRGTLAVRIPDVAITREVLAGVGAPVIAKRWAALEWGPGKSPDEATQDDRARKAGIAMLIDDGPARYGTSSSTIRLTPQGGYQVVHEGALDKKTIDRALERVVLFVCTGNTCRSPMAENIARGIWERLTAARVPVRFVSAGIAAGPGGPMTDEAAQVVSEMGFDVRPTRSRALTSEMVREADVIYGMTRGHVRAVIAGEPSAAGKTSTLDPSGGDIIDPLGGPIEVYRETAERLSAIIARRIEEMVTRG